MDARRARRVHRNAVPKSSCRSIALLRQVSKCVPAIRNVLSQVQDNVAHCGRPSKGTRLPAPATPCPAILATALSSLQTAPQPRIRQPRQLRDRAGWLFGTKRASLAPSLQLAAPATPDSLSAVPALRAPAGRAGRLRLCQRSGAGQFLRNLPPSSSLLWAKKEAKVTPTLHSSPQGDPPHQYFANSRAVGGPEQKGEPFPSSWTLQGSSPLPPPPRAPMTRSPAHFERLPGLPAARRAPVAAGGPSATAARGGRFHPLREVLYRIPAT